MNDYHDLLRAMKKMKAAEGPGPTEMLVWDVLRGIADKDMQTMGEELSKDIKVKQKERGSKNPAAGPLLCLEVLAKIGMLLDN